MINTPEENDLLEALTKTAKGRMQLIEELSVDHPDNWQTVSTPYDIVREMCDLLPSDVSHYCILFSLEFLEVLIKERDACPSNIIFFGDNQLETDVAAHEMMYGVRTGVISKHEIAVDGFDCSVLDGLLQEGKKSLLGDDMKFSKLAVLQNPPYQMQSGDSPQAKPIYHLFIETIIDRLCPDYLVTICPSRWMVGGMGLGKFRDRMRNDSRIKNIVHFPGTREVFSSVGIGGGVSYFLWDKNHNEKCEFVVDGTKSMRNLNAYDIIVQDNNAIPILEKIKSSSKKWIISEVSSINPFLKAFSSSSEIRGLLHSNKKKDTVICYGVGKKIMYAKHEAFLDKNNIIGKWKVVVGKVVPEGASFTGDVRRHLKSPFIIEPGSICTETYIVLKSFDSKLESENFITYVKTKFFRFIVGMHLSGQNISKDNFAWVPDVEDYSTAWKDQEIYDKYNLSRQERAYIESKIKELK